MNSVTRSVLGIALTAGAVYFFDPVSGRRRRVIVRDRCAQAARKLDRGTRDARHEAAHRLEGLTTRTKARFTRDQASDKAVRKHVLAALEEATTFPQAIDLTVDDGHVVLRGDVLAHEHQRVLDEVREIYGVRIITDHLTVLEGWEAVKSLDEYRHGDGWSVAGRVLVGATGCALLAWGVRERKALGEFGQRVWNYSSEGDLDSTLRHAKDAIAEGADTVEKTVRNAAREASDYAQDFGSIRPRAGDATSPDKSRLAL